LKWITSTGAGGWFMSLESIKLIIAFFTAGLNIYMACAFTRGVTLGRNLRRCWNEPDI
jgi:hypothetical protein